MQQLNRAYKAMRLANHAAGLTSPPYARFIAEQRLRIVRNVAAVARTGLLTNLKRAFPVGADSRGPESVATLVPVWRGPQVWRGREIAAGIFE